MSEEIVYYIASYGYLAVFVLVFLQEIGMPNPLPNELLLMFSGYLSFKGLLFLPFVILTAVSADFIGTNLLYVLFYNAGTIIMQKKPKWVPISAETINKLTTKLSKGGQLSIYIFRLTPFIRGYTSVIAGLLRVKPKVFFPIAMFSAVTWASFYVIIGKLIGSSWNLFIQNTNSYKSLMLAVFAVILCVFFVVSYFRKWEKHDENEGTSIHKRIEIE